MRKFCAPFSNMALIIKPAPHTSRILIQYTAYIIHMYKGEKVIMHTHYTRPTIRNYSLHTL
jgi:hypothetical protein